VNHKQIIEAGRNPVLALPKGFPQQSFQTITQDCVSAGFFYGDTKSRIATIVFCHIKRKQPIAQTPTTSQNGFELPVTDKSFLFLKRKPHTLVNW